MRVQWGEGIIWPLTQQSMKCVCRGGYSTPLPPQIGSGPVMEAWPGWVRSYWPVPQMFASKPETTPVSISLPSVHTLPAVSPRYSRWRETSTLPRNSNEEGEMNEQTASSFCCVRLPAPGRPSHWGFGGQIKGTGERWKRKTRYNDGQTWKKRESERVIGYRINRLCCATRMRG